MQRLYLTLILVLAAIGVAAFIGWRFFYLSTIALDPVPSEATITVNGKPVADRTIQVPRGTYRISVSAPGYRTQALTFNVSYGSQVQKRVTLAALPRPTKVVSGPINSLVPTVNRQEVFYNLKGTLYHLVLGTTPAVPPIPITPAIPNLETVNWSPDFGLALLRKTTGETGLYDFNRYDLLHQEYRALSSTWGATAWSLDGTALYYENTATGDRHLGRATRAGANQTRLMDLATFPIARLTLTGAPSPYLVAAGTDPTTTTDVVLIDTNAKTILPVTDSGRAHQPILSPNKSLIAYLDSGELVTSEVSGKNKRNHKLRPKNQAFTFIDEVNVAVFTTNQVTIINTSDGSQQAYEIYAPSDAIESLFADPSGKILYYVYQGDLYQISYR